MDNDATHEHPEVLAWLADTPRWTFHFTPTSCAWLNAVEGFLSKLTGQALRRGVFRSVDDLVATIERYVAHANDDPKPFVWTASAAGIMAKMKMHHPTASEHTVDGVDGTLEGAGDELEARADARAELLECADAWRSRRKATASPSRSPSCACGSRRAPLRRS